jgi:hypothetical protein
MATLTTYDFGQLFYRDTVWTKQPRGASPWERYSSNLAGAPANTTVLYDDFECNNTTKTTDIWQVVKGTGGSITLAGPGSSNNNGWVSIPTAAAAANDYQTFWTQSAQYALSSNAGPLLFEVYLNLTEANTNKASWFCGFSSTTTTGFLQNTGAPAANYSGAVFWKAQGAMALNFQTSNATTQTSTSSPIATVVSGQSYILGAYIDPNDGVTAKATYYASTVSGSPLAINVLGSATLNLTVASLASMYFGFGVRCASASAETLFVDYAQVYGSRVLI